MEFVQKARFVIGGLLIGASLTLLLSQYSGLIEFSTGKDGSVIKIDGRR